MCKAMAFELGRVPFHVPGCDVLSGRKNNSVRRSVRVDPSQVDPSQVDPSHRRAMDFDGVQQMGERLYNTACAKHYCTTQKEATELFYKVIDEEKVTIPALKAVCARLLENANNKGYGGKDVAFIIMVQLFMGEPESRKFLDDVRDKRIHAADSTEDAVEIAFALTGMRLYLD